MSDWVRCQSRNPIHGGAQCGRRAAYRYDSMSRGPVPLCDECARRFAAEPWMAKRLTPLDDVQGEMEL